MEDDNEEQVDHYSWLDNLEDDENIKINDCIEEIVSNNMNHIFNKVEDLYIEDHILKEEEKRNFI